MSAPFSTLLKNPMFSDLTLKCEGQDFKVHRFVVSSQSPVFEAACKGNFLEASEGVINVTAGNAAALERLVVYLYTGDYDDVDPSRSREKAGPAVQTDKDEVEVPVAQGVSVTELVAGIDDLHHDDTGDEEIEQATIKFDGHRMLIANAQVYILAEYYQISKLKELATTKFKNAIPQYPFHGFGEVISLVYGSEDLASAGVLKAEVDTVLINNRIALIVDEELREHCFQLPELMKSILPKFIVDFHDKIKVHAASEEEYAIKLKAKERKVEHAEWECQNAKLEAEFELERVRASVNKAKRCRHCSVDCNVRFKKEPKGDQKYSLRCDNCDTRY